MRRAQLQQRQQPPPAQPRRPCHRLAMPVLQQRPLSLLLARSCLLARPCLQAARLSLLQPLCLLRLLRVPPIQRRQQEAMLQVPRRQRRRRRRVRSRLHRPLYKSARRSGNGWAAGGADHLVTGLSDLLLINTRSTRRTSPKLFHSLTG